MDNINCNACENLRRIAPDFIADGLDDTERLSLKNNTGLKPESGNNDCDDLNDMNDCLIGMLIDRVETHDVCDWKVFMREYLPNLWTVLSAMISAICGLWEHVSSSQMTRYIILTGHQSNVERYIEVDRQIPAQRLAELGITQNMAIVAAEQGWASDLKTKTPRYATGIFPVRAATTRETATVYPSVNWDSSGNLHILMYNASSEAQDLYYRIVFLDTTGITVVTEE